MLYKADTIYEILRGNMGIQSGHHQFECQDEVYEVELIKYEDDLIVSSSEPIGKEEDDVSMLVLYVKGNLDISSGVTLIPKARRKGFTIFVTGKLTNNGVISMSLKGAAAEGQNVYLAHDVDRELQIVPALGALGGIAVTTSWTGNYDSKVNGRSGVNAVGRQSGGGMSGDAVSGWSNPPITSGRGGQGTSYSGGAGGGSVVAVDGSSKPSFTGESAVLWKAGRAMSWSARVWQKKAWGGLGIPNGLMVNKHTTYVGYGNTRNDNLEEGTGGLLIIFCNQFQNNNRIEAKGASWAKNLPAASQYNAFGGASGGGSVNIFVRQVFTHGVIDASGGIGYHPNTGGGNGSVTLTELSPTYFLLKDNEEILV